jgi:hypothetical protein
MKQKSSFKECASTAILPTTLIIAPIVCYFIVMYLSVAKKQLNFLISAIAFLILIIFWAIFTFGWYFGENKNKGKQIKKHIKNLLFGKPNLKFFSVWFLIIFILLFIFRCVEINKHNDYDINLTREVLRIETSESNKENYAVINAYYYLLGEIKILQDSNENLKPEDKIFIGTIHRLHDDIFIRNKPPTKVKY